MKYYPVSFEKDGNEFVAVKMKGGFESDNENEVYEWILDYDSKQFDFEKFSKMSIEELMENKPVNYYVFSDDSVGYAVIERRDCGEDKVDFYENEEILKKVLAMSKAEIVPIDPDLIFEIPTLPVSIDGTICICPTDLYEGFFVAKIRRK